MWFQLFHLIVSSYVAVCHSAFFFFFKTPHPRNVSTHALALNDHVMCHVSLSFLLEAVYLFTQMTTVQLARCYYWTKSRLHAWG